MDRTLVRERSSRRAALTERALTACEELGVEVDVDESAAEARR